MLIVNRVELHFVGTAQAEGSGGDCVGWSVVGVGGGGVFRSTKYRKGSRTSKVK